MQTMQALQNLIHKLETGRFARYILLALTVVIVAGIYNLRCFQNMAAPEAMDAAQLGRNIARGKGYTTQFIRPLSIYLVTQKNGGASDKDAARLNTGHPDIVNPPAYPVVLAGLMKVLPFEFDTSLKNAFWSMPDSFSASGRRGIRYQPDFLITLFNQALFLVVIGLAFFWARWLFDAAVAWTSIFVLLGAELLWHFSVSGLPTMLLMLIFMGLLWCLTLCEREAREPKWGIIGLVVSSVAAGALTGAGGLTSYAFVWMIVPVVSFLAFFSGPRRMLWCGLALAAFAAVMTPWLARNYAVCGKPLGIAGYSIIEGMPPEFHLQMSEFRLQRSLQPTVPALSWILYWGKLAKNLQPILQNDLFKMAGGWISAFFLAGLMVGFRNPALRRLRYFVVGSIVTLAIAQALARTQLSDETPQINSENLLVLLAPVLSVYGVGLFYLLLDNIKFPIPQLRYVAIGLFALVLWLPMLFTILSPKRNPLIYPPYRPDVIEGSARLMTEGELIMSDIPWAVAWYGDRQSVWLTLNATANPQQAHDWQESFFAVNELKPIHALYLTPQSLDSRFQSQWIRAGELSWGSFVMGAMLRKELPPMFPLTKMPPGYWPEQLLLCDRARW